MTFHTFRTAFGRGTLAATLGVGIALSAGSGGASTLIGDDVRLFLSNSDRDVTANQDQTATVGVGADFTLGFVSFDLAAGPDNK